MVYVVMISFYHTACNVVVKVLWSLCLSNAIHCMGQSIKSLAACVCARTSFWAEYLENLYIEVRFQRDTIAK